MEYRRIVYLFLDFWLFIRVFIAVLAFFFPAIAFFLCVVPVVIVIDNLVANVGVYLSLHLCLLCVE